MENQYHHVFRIIDANCNRLREALRVIEEFFRFSTRMDEVTLSIKTVRHSVESLHTCFDSNELLKNRNTNDDPFSSLTTDSELKRTSLNSVLVANFKRAQEAARVIEEYSKVIQSDEAPQKAKEIRFHLYSIEKNFFLEKKSEIKKQ